MPPEAVHTRALRAVHSVYDETNDYCLGLGKWEPESRVLGHRECMFGRKESLDYYSWRLTGWIHSCVAFIASCILQRVGWHWIMDYSWARVTALIALHCINMHFALHRTQGMPESLTSCIHTDRCRVSRFNSVQFILL